MKQLVVPTVKSLFIEMNFGDTLLATGTATLVANDRNSHCALITARHNVTGRHQDTGAHLSKRAAEPDNLVIYFHETLDDLGDKWKKIRLPLYKDNGQPWWIEHPSLGATADIVALNLNWGSDIVKYPYYFDTELDKHNLVIHPSETLSVIGFPFGLSSYEKLPVWATGFLAQDLSLLDPQKPTFLIDCRTRQGQSGSPVIAYRAGMYRHVKDGKIVSTVTAGAIWEFLGIYSGRVNAESDLGRVWHVSAVKEVLAVAAEEMEKIKSSKPVVVP